MKRDVLMPNSRLRLVIFGLVLDLKKNKGGGSTLKELTDIFPSWLNTTYAMTFQQLVWRDEWTWGTLAYQIN